MGRACTYFLTLSNVIEARDRDHMTFDSPYGDGRRGQLIAALRRLVSCSCPESLGLDLQGSVIVPIAQMGPVAEGLDLGPSTAA